MCVFEREREIERGGGGGCNFIQLLLMPTQSKLSFSRGKGSLVPRLSLKGRVWLV